ncbi:MAG: PIN domain-containing protein [Candidatus Omnitrophota bacterium]|jgi:predicted nucleic acid-binding protein|nr:MAG: PIN domain-containing protein [Candidatus Omnitrophota bacterium]
MKRRIYIETSVVSYYVSKPSKNIIIAGHQVSTIDFWDLLGDFDVYISDVVIQEASQGDACQARKRLDALANFPVLEIDDEVKALVKALLNGKSIAKEYPEDALHIAVAAKHGIDVIVTWNYKHINNPFTRMMVRQVIENEGFACPEICSPNELLGDET